MSTRDQSSSRPRVALVQPGAARSRWRRFAWLRAPIAAPFLACRRAARAIVRASLPSSYAHTRSGARTRRSWLDLSGPALTLLLAVLCLLFYHQGSAPFHPMTLLLAAIVYTVCVSGLPMGLLSVGIAFLCDGYYIVAGLGTLQAAVGDAILLAVVVPPCFALVAALRRQAEVTWAERERRLREEAQMEALRRSQAEMDEALKLASHELRTPLATLKLNAQQAQKKLRAIRAERTTSPDLTIVGATPPAELARTALSQLDQALDCLNRVEVSVGALDRMSRDLLDASRMQTSQLSLDPVPCDLIALVEGVVQEQRAIFPEREVIVHVPALPVLVEVDFLRIGQVVGNYLSNAFKYSPADQPTEVTLTTSGGTARVAVRDQGPGIPIEARERIWQRFERVHAEPAGGASDACPTGGGLGLGLYLCRGLVERSGGAVGVECGTDPRASGATFWLTLPLLCA